MNFSLRLKAVPIYLLMLDLLFGVALNIKDALLPSSAPLPHDGLPVSPEFAFGWMQVVANGGMALVLIWALWVLLALWRGLYRGRGLRWSFWRIWALLLVLVFSLSAWWHWLWAFVALLQGRWLIDWYNVRYLIVALCSGVCALPSRQGGAMAGV